MSPVIDASMDSGFARVSLRRDLLATENSVEAERDCLLKELNLYKMENEQLKILILERNAAMEAMSKCLLDMVKKVATIISEKELP